jgi:hypothetical protein
MPKAPKKRKVLHPILEQPDVQPPLTLKEVDDEVERIRSSVFELAKRLERLSWALSSRGVQASAKIFDATDDIPF